jgi:hypothetical protein
MMGVVFDEVTASVAPEPSQGSPQREPVAEDGAEVGEALRWQQLQAAFQRRRSRLEAD